MRLLLALSLAAVFGACAPRVYTHATKGTQEFHQDYSKCAAQAGQACGHGEYSRNCKNRMEDSCLRGEGWAERAR